MDDDEFIVLIVSAIITLIGAFRWYLLLWRTGPIRRQSRIVLPLAITPLSCLFLLWLVLSLWADPQVRDAVGYLSLFLAVGGSILGFTALSLPIVIGISVRDDAIERRNGPAAAIACGALIGVTVTFAGANIGTGPTIWTTLEPATLALATLAVVWWLHAILSGVPEAIAIDRNPAAAVRLIGFHLTTAFILGRSVAGDWISEMETVRDFAREGWPVLLILLAAVMVEQIQSRRSWHSRRAIAPAVVVVAIEIVIVFVALILIGGRS